MSSTISWTPPSPTSSPQSNDASTMQRGANYFFGFLITFVALLLIFVGYGVGTRRRFATRRRAAFIANFDPWGDGTGSIADQLQPTFWEPRLVTGGDKWSTMLPLSTMLLRPEVKQHPITPRRTPLHVIPALQPWLPMPRNPDTSRTSNEPPEALQVAVMIAMPSPYSEHDTRTTDRADGDQKLEVYQIGVARVPWEGKDLVP